MTAVRTTLPLLAALLLAVAALLAVQRAGCDDPGRYEPLADGSGYELVGGCLEPGDVVVPELPPVPDTPSDAARS